MSEHIGGNSHNQSYFGEHKIPVCCQQSCAASASRLWCRTGCSAPNSLRVSLDPAAFCKQPPCTAPIPYQLSSILFSWDYFNLPISHHIFPPAHAGTDCNSWQAGWKPPPWAVAAFWRMSWTLAGHTWLLCTAAAVPSAGPHGHPAAYSTALSPLSQ